MSNRFSDEKHTGHPMRDQREMRVVRYTQEQRQWAIGQKKPPHSRTVVELAIYSRKLIVNEVNESESSTHVCSLMARGCLREQTAHKPVFLHSDNGSAIRGSNLMVTMLQLSQEPSFGRPMVSNDNAYAEALFRSAKYCPMWPEKPFDTPEQARAWMIRFVAWYNEEYRYSGLKYVTPSQQHRGQDKTLMGSRSTLYETAKARNPRRWTSGVRNWCFPHAVFLNPERAVKAQAAADLRRQVLDTRRFQ